VISIDNEGPKTTGISGPQDLGYTAKPAPKTDSADHLEASQSTQPPSLQSIVLEKLGIANASNPFVCIFHMMFKAAAITTYLFSGFFFNTVMIFLLVSIFTVLDFWVVKNISGR